MADDCSVIRQPNVLGIVLIVFALGSAWLLLVDNEGALHVDAHVTGMLDGVLDVALDGRPTRTRCFWG